MYFFNESLKFNNNNTYNLLLGIKVKSSSWFMIHITFFLKSSYLLYHFNLCCVELLFDPLCSVQSLHIHLGYHLKKRKNSTASFGSH